MILLDPLARPVIGHRGNRAHAPEETLAALLDAVALGVDALEFDVHVSADGQLVLFHDPTLERTTNGRGAVARHSLAELQRLDAGYRFTTDGGQTFPWRDRSAHIASFDEAIETLPPHLPFIIEIKTAAAAGPLHAAIARHDLARRVIVAGFDARFTVSFRQGTVPLGACTSDVVRCLPRALLGKPIRPAFSALCIPPAHRGIPVPIASLVRHLQGSGITTHVWTINDPAQAVRLWDVGVNGIITDDPAVILAVRRSQR